MIATRNSLPQSSSVDPAANALSHGMTARRFVAPDQADRMWAIQAHLFAIHDPVSNEEVHCVEELALAQAQLYDVEVAAWERLEWEKSHARERYDRHTRDQFDKDLAACRKNPYIWLDILTMTWLGACHMARVWAEIADQLAQTPARCPLDRILDAIASQKSDYRVDTIDSEGRWILQRHLAISPDPRAELEAWLKIGCTGAGEPRDDQRAYARRILEKAPDPATAQRELLEKAIAERDRWTLKANDLRSRYETDRNLAADRAVFYVPADEKATRESRLALRYLTAARNRVEKLERRIEALRRLRPVRNLRQRNDFVSPLPCRTPIPSAEESRSIAGIEAIEPENEARDIEKAERKARFAAIEREIKEIEAHIAAGEAALAEEEACSAKINMRGDSMKGSAAKEVADCPGSGQSTGRRADPAEIARAFRKKMAKK